MHFGSLDSFLVEDVFWQERMGKPIANRDFLLALLRHGTFDGYHLFCPDSDSLRTTQGIIEEALPEALHDRITLAVQALFGEIAAAGAIDVMHLGDFTYHMPYLMEYRNRSALARPFAVSGVTHSLDGAMMQTRFLQLLLARPRPSDAVVCTSAAAMALLAKAFEQIRDNAARALGAALPAPPELVHIPLAIADEFDRPMDRGACRRALGLADDAFVMLSLGRLSLRHKMDLAPLLECLQWLDASGALPSPTLILAGGATEENVALVDHMVRHLGLEARVRMDANVSFERKRQLYGAADVFLSLVDNHQETFGLTVLEAMAHGLPTVVSDFSGYRELVADGETGFRIPTYASADAGHWDPLAGLLDPSLLGFYRAQKVAFDFAALAAALRRLAAEPGLRHRLGETGRARSRDYRWPRIIARYEEMWRNRAVRPNDEAQVGDPPPLLAPAVARQFSHYATTQLDAGSVVRLSAYGRYRTGQAFTPVVYEDSTVLLDTGTLQGVIGVIEHGPAAVGDIVAGVERALDVPAWLAMVHLDFLLKHGFAEVDPDADTPSRASPAAA